MHKLIRYEATGPVDIADHIDQLARDEVAAAVGKVNQRLAEQKAAGMRACAEILRLIDIVPESK